MKRILKTLAAFVAAAVVLVAGANLRTNNSDPLPYCPPFCGGDNAR